MIELVPQGYKGYFPYRFYHGKSPYCDARNLCAYRCIALSAFRMHDNGQFGATSIEAVSFMPG